MTDYKPVFQVEYRLPQGTKVAAAAEFSSFDAALAWIEQQLQADKTRICRLLSNEILTKEQAAKLARYQTERN
jgi:hypothetical protein